MSDRVLPKDVWILVFKNLQLHVTALCRQVCKSWKDNISSSCFIWKSKNYQEFCEKVNNIPLKYHYIFEPRKLSRPQFLMFLDMCQYTYKKQLTSKYKLVKKEHMNKIDLIRFRDSIMLYLVVQNIVTLEQLSLLPMPPSRVSAQLHVFCDIAVYYIIEHNGIQNLVGKTSQQISNILTEWGTTEENRDIINRTRGMRSRFLMAYFSEYGKIILERNLIPLDDLIKHPLRFLALTRNEYGIIGLQDKLFGPEIINTYNNCMCFALCSYLIQKGLREGLFTITDLSRISDELITKVFGKYREGLDCLREKLFTLEDCKKLKFPQYLRFLLCDNGITALKEGLVTLENVHLHFPWDDATLIPRKMSDEQLANIRELKKIKIGL